MPKVSVIMPVYNTATYLDESINSILNQTLKDFELWIVDDGSTDGSSDIIDKYVNLDERVHAIRQNNMGQSQARNAALRQTAGKYIYFMDSDDVLNSDALYCSFYMCEKKKLDIVFFDADLIYEEKSPLLSWDYHRTINYNEDFIYDGEPLVDTMLATYSFRAVPWLYLTRKAYIDRIKLSFCPNIIHEDELFTLLLFLQSHNIGCLKRRLVKHRIRIGSTMSATFSIYNVNCYFEVFRRAILFYLENIMYENIIRKYISYTLNAIIRTAIKLSFINRIKVLVKAYKMHVLNLITYKNLIKITFGI